MAFQRHELYFEDIVRDIGQDTAIDQLLNHPLKFNLIPFNNGIPLCLLLIRIPILPDPDKQVPTLRVQQATNRLQNVVVVLPAEEVVVVAVDEVDALRLVDSLLVVE